MTTITVSVPEKDCVGCEYLDCFSYETSFQSYQERDYCQIFKCDIKNRHQCLACQLLSATNMKHPPTEEKDHDLQGLCAL